MTSIVRQVKNQCFCKLALNWSVLNWGYHSELWKIRNCPFCFYVLYLLLTEMTLRPSGIAPSASCELRWLLILGERGTNVGIKCSSGGLHVSLLLWAAVDQKYFCNSVWCNIFSFGTIMSICLFFEFPNNYWK